MKNNKYLRYILFFVLYFVIFFVLSHASIAGRIYPFAFGMLFALVWANQKVWLVCPAYITACVISQPTFESAICVVTTVAVCAIPYYIHVALKENIKKWEFLIYAPLSQVAMLVLSILNGVSPLYFVPQIILGTIFMVVAIHIFEPLIIRGISYKLTNLEQVCLAILVMVFGDGLAGIEFFGFSFAKFFVGVVLLVLSYTTKAYNACLYATILGLGTLLGSNNPVFISAFVLWALAITAFRSLNKIFPSLAIVCADLLCGFYFGLYYSYTWLDILSVVLAAGVFFVLPNRIYEQVRVLLSNNSERLAMKNIVNRNRDMLHRRLNQLSEVFYDMNDVFKRLIKKGLDPEEVRSMLGDEIREQVCKNCKEYNHCHRTFAADTKKLFGELIQISMEKGRITLLDIPSYITSRCGKTNSLISEINSLTKQYKNYSSLVDSVDTSKLLISDQLGGVSDLMKSLANEVNSMVSFDSVREGKIIDELAYNNIICSDAVVYEKDARTFVASLIVRNEDVDRVKLQQTVSRVCGNRMIPVEVFPASKAGLTTVNLKTAPRYDCVFGVAGNTKSGSSVSGDCHSVLRLDGDKFMFALCDGMGSGEVANQKSDTAIGLIENFYKAGFDNEIILSSVNKLLNLEKDDIFSTIDICVVDLKSGIADFIKMGAPSSYIRTQDECKILDGGALPIGVIQDATASTKKAVLGEKDMIVLCSDGVSDSFGSDGEFKDFILTIRSSNPQEFADSIIERALANNNGYAVDDMTCLVIKVFEP